MGPPGSRLLALNSGSSSIRFAIHKADNTHHRLLHGSIERIGREDATLSHFDPAVETPYRRRVKAPDHARAVDFLLKWLATHPAFPGVNAIGHRVVHGMKRSEPERITPKLLAELRRIAPRAPEHLPAEIGLIAACQKSLPRVPQIACFDTAFHRDLPRVAKLLPIPRRFAAKGVERYGFHGLSYAYLMEELKRLDARAARGRVILAHLGSGASLAAVRHGRSVDTTMGFTPTSGLVMSTRAGDLDPGVGDFLTRVLGLTAPRLHQVMNRESGLLGVSGTSSDVRDLIEREGTDVRAKEALALFCHQARKWIGSFAAVLGGLDTLVFSGGIGENSPVLRARICQGLGFLGISLSPGRNTKSAGIISTPASRITVRVIPTDEELMIARSVARVLGIAGVRRATKP
jgi:acetate kinase